MKQKDYDNDISNCFSDGVSGLVFWSFRYFLGRQTIHASCFARDLSNAFLFLDERTRMLIEKELEHAFKIDNDNAISTLGTRISSVGDKDTWQLVRNAYGKKDSK